jgi:co-chaperonin GroES (HSP10)
MEFNGKCLGSNVIVTPVVNRQISASGLDTTDLEDKNQKWGKGIVVSVGEGAPLDKNGLPHIKAGDTVMYDKNKTTDYVEDTILYKAMYYHDLLKVFE